MLMITGLVSWVIISTLILVEKRVQANVEKQVTPRYLWAVGPERNHKEEHIIGNISGFMLIGGLCYFIANCYGMQKIRSSRPGIVFEKRS